MYSSCLSCHADLGHNDSVEHFPVGRRLAFDAANGRFWVICPRCRRWNLSPLEERWDAIDECERLFEKTRLRMSTDNIGLARIAEGTELVRVGAAMRPEMAAWRFGAQLAARRRSYRWLVGGGVLATAGLYIGVKTVGIGLIGGNWGWGLVQGAYERITRVVLPAPTTDGLRRSVLRDDIGRIIDSSSMPDGPPRIETKHAQEARIAWSDGDEAVRITVPVVGGVRVRYFGVEAAHVAPKLLAKLNRSGGRQHEERMAVDMLERVAQPGVPDLFQGVIKTYAPKASATKSLTDYGPSINLALEMALNEQRERELLAGELLDLEFAWREAEELARIADSLGSSAIDRALAGLKARLGG